MKRLLFLLLLFLASSARAQLSPASSSSGSITTNASSCATTNACVTLHMATSNVGYSATIAGTWTGTLTVEQSGDNQGSWTSATTTTSNTLYTSALTPGITDVRVRGSAAMTGAAVVTITASGPAVLQQITQTGAGGVSPNSTSIPGIYAGAAPYSAKFDGRSSQDGVLNSTTTVTSATLSCTSADIGKTIFAINAATLAKANSTVASCSGAAFVMNAAATATESGDNLVVCSDDTTALTNAFNAAYTASLPLYLPSGLSCISARPFVIPASIVTVNPQAMVIKGAGLNATYLGMTPSFSFAGVTVGTVYENLSVNSCGYNTSAIKGFDVVTAEDWSITGFNFNFPAWPAATGTMYNICQARRVGIFNIRTGNVIGMQIPTGESTAGDNNIQGLGTGAGGAGNGIGISVTGGSSTTLFNNVIAFSGTGMKISACSGGCSVIGGLITGNSRSVDVLGSVVQLADINLNNGGATTEAIRVDGTSTANFSRVVLGMSGTGIGINILAGGKVRADMLDYQILGGTPTEISNAGSFFDAGLNNLSGTIVNTGSWFGSGSITGTTLVAGNVVPSANWGTGAAVTAPLGDSHLFSFTLTNGSAAVGANPTITLTFPTPFVTSYPVICRLEQVGGTQAVTATTAILQGTSVTSTTAVFTYPTTPTVNLTEFYQGNCGP